MIRRAFLPVEDFDQPTPRALPAPKGCSCPACVAAGRGLRCPSETWREGHAEGMAVRATADTAAAEQLALQLADALAAADAAGAEAAREAAEAIGTAVISALAALLPASLAAVGPREAAAVAATVLPALVDEPAIAIEAAPDCMEVIEAAVARLPANQADRVDITPRRHADGPELTIRWPRGEARVDIRSAFAVVRDLLDRHGLIAAGTEPPADAPPITGDTQAAIPASDEALEEIATHG